MRFLFFSVLVGIKFRAFKGHTNRAFSPPPRHYFLQDSDTGCEGHPLEKQHRYDVTIAQRNAVNENGTSLISHSNGTSDFQYNFAAAWFRANPNKKNNSNDPSSIDGLVVRLVDWKVHPEWVNAGALAIVPAEGFPHAAAHITESMVTWAGSSSLPSLGQPWGAADPRIAVFNNTYYLTWDNCTQNCWPHRTTLLSTSTDPFDKNSWTLHGDVFPLGYSGGASLLFRENAAEVQHLAFVGNSNTADKIYVFRSNDGLHWNSSTKQVFMEGRRGCWDSYGVATGPQPERLSTGDYLYIYNIDTGWPYKPNPFLGRCSIGWSILDGTDPTKIVARSSKPLLTPKVSWETCENNTGGEDECQVPMVVFSTGLKPLGNDEFLLLYGGADANVGVSKIKVAVGVLDAVIE